MYCIYFGEVKQMPINSNKYSLGHILSRTFLAFKRTATRQMNSYDITPEQFGVISELNKTDGISLKKLAGLSERDQTTAGKIIDKLIMKELVTRTADPSDRRAILLYLTPQGRELVKDLHPGNRSLEEQAFKDLDENEIEIFIKVMNKIHSNISK